MPLKFHLLKLISPLLLLFFVVTSGASLFAQTTEPLTTTAQEVTSGSAPVEVDYEKIAEQFLSEPITTEQATRSALIFVLFVIIAVAIATRKLPAMLALPLMALGIGMVAGVPFRGPDGILQAILEGKTSPAPSGSFQLYKAIIWVLFGGIFARFISDARIAERIVKYAAEYGGENPFNVALLMSAITILIFTAAGGLPMIIMLGTVMFPILLSLGVPAPVCGSILLLAFPIGAALNPAEWARVSEVFSVSVSRVRAYSLIWASLQVIVLVTFLTIEFLRMKRINLSGRSIAASLGRFALVAAVLMLFVFFDKFEPLIPSSGRAVFHSMVVAKDNISAGLKWVAWAILVIGIIVVQFNYHVKNKILDGWTLLTPILPLLFLLGLGFGEAFIPAFMASLAYGVLTTPDPQALQKLGRSIMNGVADVAAPVILMVGIGMLIAAATHPMVESILTPVLARVIPTTQMGYIIFFLLAAPLSLYRGPLNSFGLGVGVAKLMQNFMPPAATMGALHSVSMLQDPTTTQNVWICGFLKLDINALLFKLFFYSLALVVLGLILSAILFFPTGA